ncbi:MAG: hypothetical protein GX458_12290 [Phyllobacteriaceae bacterium]|nr:hypothetical protein [Phyllobacteriaceae bacterium]
MAELVPTLPAVHVALFADVDPALERQIGFGAEEEGVPTRRVRADGADPVAAAYAAARSSSFGVGLAIGAGRIALHEGHMPPERAVLEAALGAEPARLARRFGGNAARLVVRLPLRLDDEDDAVSASAPVRERARREDSPSAADVATIVARVLARLATRGTPT